MTYCKLITSLVFSLFTLTAIGQQGPSDYLSADFHKDRREALRELMPSNSVAVFFSNPIRNRANDVDYMYHQDPDFYYLTGYKEPNAVLMIFSEDQQGSNGAFNELIFAQERNAHEEMWAGRRLGPEGVKEQLKIQQVSTNTEFVNSDFDFKQFDKVMFFEFKNDVRNSGDNNDLFDMIEKFKDNAEVPPNMSARMQDIQNAMKADTRLDKRKKDIYRMTRSSPGLLDDPVVKEFMAAESLEEAEMAIAKIPEDNLDVIALPGYMNVLRETKSQEELKLLTKAVEVSCIGQVEVMKAMRPNMSETEVQGIHEFVFKKYGSEYEGYPSIVGGGNNGCILHYVDNNKPRIGTELVLMDLGAEYRGYTADVTRTVPADGTFSPEQKAIYEIVYRAQNAGFEECVVGNNFRAPNMACREIIDQGLVDLGIIEKGQNHNYFPHGTSHYLGLDVHDRGTYGDFQAGTVITVEPGIYIPAGSDCDEKWWDIAVRIEDDILITEDGWINLSGLAPRSVEDIEATMALPSPLDDFILPDLDSDKN